MATWEELRGTPVESGWKMISSAAKSFGTPIVKSLANIGALGATGWGAIQMARNKPESAQNAFDKALAARQFAGTEGSFDQGFKSGGKTLVQGGLSALQTALTGKGLSYITPTKLAISGGLGGVISKVSGGDFSTGAGQAIGSLPQILGFVAQTNPLLAKYLPKNTQLNEKVVGSLGNVGQGIAMDLARGQKPTVGGMLLDTATGYSPLSQYDMPNTKGLIDDTKQLPSLKKVAYNQDSYNALRKFYGLSSKADLPDELIDSWKIINDFKQKTGAIPRLAKDGTSWIFKENGENLNVPPQVREALENVVYKKSAKTVSDEIPNLLAKNQPIRAEIVNGNKITFEDIKKYDNSSQYNVYIGANEDIETYATRVKPESLEDYFNIQKELDEKLNLLKQNREKYYQLAKQSGGQDNEALKGFDDTFKQEGEIANLRNMLDNIVKFGNDKKEVADRYLRDSNTKLFKDISDKILKLDVNSDRKEVRLINGRPSGYFDNTQEIGKKTLSFGDIQKIKPKENQEIVDEMISSGWKGQVVNPEKRSLTTLLAKIYNEDLPISEEKSMFGNQAFADSQYNKQINNATNPKIISAFKSAIEKEQETLRKLYPSGKITLYRGIGGTKKVVEDKLLTSWTDDINVANKFGKTGTVVTKEIPIENVVLSHNTQRTLGKMGENMPDVIKGLMGGNAEQESEYIVINRPNLLKK